VQAVNTQSQLSRKVGEAIESRFVVGTLEESDERFVAFFVTDGDAARYTEADKFGMTALLVRDEAALGTRQQVLELGLACGVWEVVVMLYQGSTQTVTVQTVVFCEFPVVLVDVVVMSARGGASSVLYHVDVCVVLVRVLEVGEQSMWMGRSEGFYSRTCQ